MALYPLQQPADKVFSGNPIHYAWALYPFDAANANNIRLLVNVFAEVSNFTGTFSQVKQVTLLPQADGKFAINLQSIVDAYLAYFFPPLTLAQPVAARGQFLRFHITEQLIINGTGDTPVAMDDFTAYKGGVSYEEYNADLFFANAALFGVVPKGLTYVQQKAVCPDEYLFFYFIHLTGSAAHYKTKVSALLDDGSTGNVTSSAYGITPQENGLYVMATGYTQLGIAAMFTGNTVVNYRVTILNADNDTIAVSPLYQVDYRQYYYRRYLLWINSLGGLETLCLKGKTDVSAEYSYTAMSKSSINDYFENSLLQPRETNQQPQETMKFTGFTTWIDKAYLDTLRDLFLSRLIYELQDGKLVPVAVDSSSSSVSLYNTADQKYFLQVSWAIAYLNEFYSLRNTFSMPGSCPAVVVFNVLQLSRSSIVVIWRLINGYNRIKITITILGDTQTTYLDGNAGVQEIAITTITDDHTDIVVTGYTVCDPYSSPESLSAGTEVTVDGFGNQAPVAVADYFTMYSGFTTFQALGNCLTNDYDPDGDAITITDVTNVATTAGGHITIGTDGAVSYKPPSSGFVGTDTYVYTITDALGATATGTIHIGVGENPNANMVYVRKVFEDTTVIGAPPVVSGKVYFKFYADSTATTTKNTTGMGITINYDRQDTVSGTTTTTSHTIAAAGTQVLVYNGLFENMGTGEKHLFILQPGTGYQII